jgi:hypothetical protein
MVAELRQAQGVVSVLMLDASEIVYGYPTEDPWFSATTLVSQSSLPPGSNNSDYFLSDVPGGILGCVAQKTYCNPGLPNSIGCIDGFTGQHIGGNVMDGLSAVWQNVDDQSTVRSILSVLDQQGAGLGDLLYGIPSAPTLLARNTVFGGLQAAPLPTYQWKIERDYIFRANLVAMQAMLLDFARGYWAGDGSFCGRTDGCRRICRSQVRVLFLLRQNMRTDLGYRKLDPRCSTPLTP